jgi:hypothetical protein
MLSWTVPTICAKEGTAQAMLARNPTKAITAQVTSGLIARLARRGLTFDGACFI